jgi:hypothetical protein
MLATLILTRFNGWERVIPLLGWLPIEKWSDRHPNSIPDRAPLAFCCYRANQLLLLERNPRDNQVDTW